MALGTALFSNPISELGLAILSAMVAGLIGLLVLRYAERRHAVCTYSGWRADLKPSRWQEAEVAELERLFHLDGNVYSSIESAPGNTASLDTTRQAMNR